jgi:cytochrome b involved in lipid metabolism
VVFVSLIIALQAWNYQKCRPSSNEADFQALATSCFVYGTPTFTSIQEPSGQDAPQSDQGMISYADIQKHNSAADCWVVINVSPPRTRSADKPERDFLQGLVYDLTRFLELHPGGQQAILAEAGTDAR